MSQGKNYTLITGASAGIGKAMAEECAKRKQNLILVALPGSGLEQVSSSLKDMYQIEVKQIELNLTQANAPQYLYHWCCQHKLKINILINNAGLGSYSAFRYTSLEDYVKLIKLNAETVVALTYLFIPKLKEHTSSYILNVGSFVSLMPVPYKSVYSATKSFVLTFSRALQSELSQFGIQVSCLCPGPTSTTTVTKRNKALEQKSDILVLTPEAVARIAIDGLFKNKGLIIPGWRNRALLAISAFIPFKLKSYILKSIFQSGIEKREHETFFLRNTLDTEKCLPPLPGVRQYNSRTIAVQEFAAESSNNVKSTA